MTADPWRAVAKPPWDERAREALREIAAAASAVSSPRGAGLASGTAGIAVFLAYYGEAEDDGDAESRATELLEDALGGIGTEAGGPGLYSGIPGIAWAVEHLAGTDPEDDDEDPNAGVDSALGRLLETSAWTGPYDLVGGLCGLAVYFLERLPRPAAVRSLEAIAGHLEALSELASPGRTWHTPPEHLPESQRELAPAGYYNTGMAHGVPGIVSVLSRLVVEGIAAQRAKPLLEDAVAWLLAQQGSTAGARYPSWVLGSGHAEPSRTAWCYGDPGVACALFAAGRAAGEPAWERAAVELALGAARRPEADCGVRDAAICHGAFGLAHIFRRFHRATGIEEFDRAASGWIERGLAFRRPGEGVAGFFASRPGGPDPEPGFLEGAAGIGLVLLAALTDLEPEWDRVLLVDI